MADTTLHEMSPDTALAIVGMAGRFPGAAGVDQFWQNVAGGIKSIRIFSEAELEAAGVEDALLRQPNYVKAGTVVADVELFDAAFFGYNPREAELMDPQHRLFLECAWEALERAACDPDTYGGRIGVFAGSGFSMYMLNNLYSNPELIQSVPALQIAVGNERDSLASTVSYKLNLKGPSIAVQTFCSTSLVATHLACQSLLTFESDVALAGGVAINIPQEKGYEYHEGDIVSPDGECRTFDAAANGSVIGNGVGVVALKRLEDALEDGDVIYAVIRGSAVNNDGILKVGYTAPGMSGQASVITEALANAGVEPDTISYVEAHGTATPLGDAVELAAMHKAFTARTAQTGFCALGSVKPNVGHLDRASGVTGLIKTALALQHQQLPPSLNFAQPNPALDLHDGPFYVNTTLRDWPRGTTPRRAGVSSFGLGGTNAHVVLEEAPERAPSPPAQGSQLLLLSAKTSTALEAMAANLAAYLERQPELNLADVASTLQVGRSAFNHRRMVVAADISAAVAALRGEQGVRTAEQTQRDRPVVFLLPGVGDHYVDMAHTLYATEPAFRAAVEQCCAALRPHLGRDLLPRFAAPGDAPAEPASAEALLWVVEYALAQLVGTWGIRPAALLGVGVGEYVAACLAGVLSLADAAALVAARGHAAPAPPAVTFQPPRVPYISQLSGTWITAAEATDPAYWTRLQAQPGDAAVDLAALCASAQQVYLEVGPGAALSACVAAHVAAMDASTPAVIAVLGERGAAEAGTGLPDTLGRLWLAGVEVDWTGVHAGAARQRVMLPTYPFERQRYWIETRPATAPALTANLAPEVALANLPRHDLADWFYLPGWKQSAPLTPAVEGADAGAGRCWLIMEDACGIGVELGRWLRDHDQRVVSVAPGASFTRYAPDAYRVRPEIREDYDALLRMLHDEGQAPAHVVHLWHVTPSPAELDDAGLATAVNNGFYSLLALSQALGELDLDACRITVVASDTHNVTGDEQICPAKAMIAGPAKMIPVEYPNLTCRSIDLKLPGAGSRQALDVIDQLLGELTTQSADPVVALRGNRRWVETFELMPLPERAGAPTRLREGGVYLITGGLGGIGLAMAEHLARTVQAKLALVGRSGLPPRQEWAAVLNTEGDEAGIGRQIRQVQRLEELGAEVLVVAADVADEMRMQAAVRETIAHFGTLNGVLHAAGVPGAGLMRLKTVELAERVLAPKVRGTLVLERVLADVPLDFLALFSSIASTTGGGPGQVDYCAANAFLDAYAQQNHTRHGVTIAINWGEWQWNAWEEGLSGHDAEVQTFLRENRRRFGIAFEEGTAALSRILARRFPRVIVSPQDFPAVVAASRSFTTAYFRERILQTKPVHPRPALATSYVAPRNDLERQIAAVWGELLGIAEVGINDNFFDLGGNSLVGIDVIDRLRKELKAESIPAHVLYEAPSISALADFITQNDRKSIVIEARLDRGAKRRERQTQRQHRAS